MKAEGPQNVAASVHQRLLNKARESGRPFNELLQLLAMERLLYRLAQSPHTEDFVLKGALMLPVWQLSVARPTMDIDLLGRVANDQDHIAEIVQRICRQSVEEDGFAYEPESVIVSRITERAKYEGVRVRFRGSLGNARLTLQIDIGFGDEVFPGPQDIEFPSMLGFPAPKLKGYTRESAIAEKFAAMLQLGELNSRVKDFFDIWILSRQFNFEAQTLRVAIERAISHRPVSLILEPTVFREDFREDPIKNRQWKGFLRKNRLAFAPPQFSDVVLLVAEFLRPVLECIIREQTFLPFWKAPGPWRHSSEKR